MTAAFLTGYEYLILKRGESIPAGALVMQFVFSPPKPGIGQVSKESGEIHLIQLAEQQSDHPQYSLLVSLGNVEKVQIETYRKAAGAAAKWLVHHRIEQAAILVDELDLAGLDGSLLALLEGFLLGAFQFTRHKSSNSDPFQPKITLVSQAPSLDTLIDRIGTICAASNLARDWGHEPGNIINPLTLAQRTAELCQAANLKCTVLDETALANMHAGGILSAGQGSQTPSRMIVIEYAGTGKPGSQPLVLVGKALTFDTGGYSLKELAKIQGMKRDKTGGIVVLAVLLAAAGLGLKQPLVGIIGAAENMISGHSYRPDDILTTMSGKTVEIITTDAEGRLVLADCLTYAQNTYQPSAIIDIATLTSGVTIALGRIRAGVMSNNDELADALIYSGENVYERLWRLPLDDEYLKNIRGEDADLKNSGGSEAHPIAAGVFLKEFIQESTKWAHLDIAGVAITPNDLPYCPKGNTGFGVRLLVNYLEGLQPS